MSTVYYSNNNLKIRSIEATDPKIFYETYLSYGWHPSLEVYENYLREQAAGTRIVLIAEMDGKVAGVCTLIKNASEGPWANRGVPVIVDLSVFKAFRNRGIGNKLLDVVEQEAAKLSDIITLSVGVHSGYGAAQRIYVRRGYLPDGSGAWYGGKPLEQYAPCRNDDDLQLYMFKKL